MTYPFYFYNKRVTNKENIDEASESAQVSNKLLNVSEFEDIDSATESLTAVSQAYSDLSKNDIVDRLNYVGNNFSISTDEISEGLQKASATLLTQGKLVALDNGNII